MIYTTTGRIDKSIDTSQKPGWYRVLLDDDIGDYYHWLYSRGFRRWAPAMNGVHVTFIAGEKDARIVTPEELFNLNVFEVELSYQPVVFTNTRAFWLPALSEDLDRLREALGLPPRLLYHITLGNIKNG